MVRRVGILGYGKLGKYLVSNISNNSKYELAFVWNRTRSKLDLDEKFILDDIDNFEKTRPDIVVEVAHPSITKHYGKKILKHCDYMVGSPSALCDENLLKDLQDAATDHGLYIPCGALWASEDIKKMADAKQLKSLTVTIRKHPLSLQLEGHLKEKNLQVKDEPVTLLKGPVRDICALVPRNTNMMAVAAIAASNLGFDNVVGCVISDPSLTNYRIIEVEAFGFPKEDGSCFHVHIIRRNLPNSEDGTVQATYVAYFGSLKRAEGKGPGLHLC